MRVLVIGATGLIGTAVVARLIGEGHAVVGLSRHVGDAARRWPMATWAAADIGRLVKAETWLPHLAGIDAVVNCAGILQDAPGERVADVHAHAIGALAAACQHAGIRRIVQVSALGVADGRPTAFMQTKAVGDQALMDRDLDWVVLRPSVVVGRQAYGGSALFRGLAALPWLPLVPGTGDLQIVQLDDVAATVAALVRPDAPARVVLDLAGPDRLPVEAVVAAYRRWLGWRDARVFTLPRPLAAFAGRLGDLAALLGWRPPLRSTMLAELGPGAIGDPAEWTRVTGIRPKSLIEALATEPAGVQERWFAGLYVLKALIFVVFSLFWIATGLVSVGPGYGLGRTLLEAGGIAPPLVGPMVIAGGLADLAIGLAIAWRRTTKLGLWAALAISLFYAAAGTIVRPDLWAEPLGPLLKIWPIVMLNLVALAILRDR